MDFLGFWNKHVQNDLKNNIYNQKLYCYAKHNIQNHNVNTYEVQRVHGNGLDGQLGVDFCAGVLWMAHWTGLGTGAFGTVLIEIG